MIKRFVDLEVSLTPDEIASEFCSMGSGEQVAFLNAVAEVVREWDKSFAFQLQAVTDDERLTDDARYIMELFGEYSTPKESYQIQISKVPLWRPIETAPKDGTVILLKKDPIRYQVAPAIADGFMANGRWVWPFVHKDPTHWMPIPE